MVRALPDNDLTDEEMAELQVRPRAEAQDEAQREEPPPRFHSPPLLPAARHDAAFAAALVARDPSLWRGCDRGSLPHSGN